MELEDLNRWYPPQQQTVLIERLIQHVGMTGVRAECFVRLWIYLRHKQQLAQGGAATPPWSTLTCPTGAVACTHREAAEVFYGDKEQGSDRAAGMMLDKLTALGLIKKSFDGNTTRIEIQPVLLQPGGKPEDALQGGDLMLDDFDPRCDTVPIANLLATNYNWMNRNQDTLPHRIARLLRQWAGQYLTGMRVLRRSDNLNPVAFYLLYPTTSGSDATFFGPPSKGLHLSGLTDVDPFQMATPGDPTCVSVFVRSWMIDPLYLERYRVVFLQDVQATLVRMRQDFPNLWDMHTLIIHPSYEVLASALGFQRTGQDTQTSLYWMYLAIDRYLALNIEAAIAQVF